MEGLAEGLAWTIEGYDGCTMKSDGRTKKVVRLLLVG